MSPTASNSISNTIAHTIATNRSHDRLIQLISPWILPLGYQVVHVEIQSHPSKVLRVFIEHSDLSGQLIGIEDCVKVSHALNEQIDQLPEIDQLFPGGYDLEVSSPGLNRPLRTETDFKRFIGQPVRIHTFRPLTVEESENSVYSEKNPKQKNFLGQLSQVKGDRIMISIASQKNSVTEIAIPLSLISKANLEPELKFERDERE